MANVLLLNHFFFVSRKPTVSDASLFYLWPNNESFKHKYNWDKDPMSYLHLVDKWNNLPSGFYSIWQHAWNDSFYVELRDMFYYLLFPYYILRTQSKNFMEALTTNLTYTTVTYIKASLTQMNCSWIQKTDFSSGQSGRELYLW